MLLQALLVWASFSIIPAMVNVTSKERSKKGCAVMRSCMEPFPMIVDLIEKDKSSALATLTYGVLLDSICSKQELLKECVSKPKCPNFEKSYAPRAVMDILEYICGEGRAVLLSEAGCFSRDDFEWGTYQCSRIMRLESDIATLQSQTTRTQTRSEKINKLGNDAFCRVFDNLLKCIHMNVERTCSTTAANFTRSVFGKTVKPLAKKLGCTLK